MTSSIRQALNLMIFVLLVAITFLMAIAVLSSPSALADPKDQAPIDIPPSKRFKTIEVIEFASWDHNTHVREVRYVYIVEDAKEGVEYALWHGDNHMIELGKDGPNEDSKDN